MQSEITRLENEVRVVQQEEFQQRFDTVRLMHVMLSRLRVVPAPHMPPIHLNPHVLPPEGEHGIEVPPGAVPLLTNVGSISRATSMDVCNEPPMLGRGASIAESLHAGSFDLPESGAGPEELGVLPISRLDAAEAVANAPPLLAVNQATGEQGVQGQQLVLPNIPLTMKELPPAGTAEREHLEHQIDWYFEQLSLTANQILATLPPENVAVAQASMEALFHGSSNPNPAKGGASTMRQPVLSEMATLQAPAHAPPLHTMRQPVLSEMATLQAPAHAPPLR